MSELTISNQSTTSKIGWGVLLFVAVSNVLGHIGLAIFESGPDTVFIAWATFNLLAAIILVNPYRRGERWAWYAISVTAVPFALVIFSNPEIGPIYLVEATLIVLGQILTYSGFFGK
jgi:hypothetical protein